MTGRIIAGALAALALTAAPAGAASLYDGPGPRPGPDILYADAPRAPQLENTGEWKAPPILVSGATSYRDGEFVYQDYLYDDHGARFTRDRADERSGDDTFSQPNGTYRYPTGPGYEQNAADLVELRVKPAAGATLFRLTLNTMTDPEIAAATIAIGDSPAPLPIPDGANATVRAQYFLTWHGGSATLRDATTGATVANPAVAVDKERRQIQISVPTSAWNPGTSTVKMAAAVGLWDKAANRYAQPRQDATADTPGGGAAGAAAFFNVAFRTKEPFQTPSDGASLFSDPAWWRDRQQGNELRNGSLDAFRADVDFGKLAAGTNDDSGVPQQGPINRIVASHFETQQGVDFGYNCGRADECKGELRGRLQPYALYVPSKKGANGYGLTLALHSLGANYNQFSASRNQSQWGERGPGSLVMTPSGRGPDGWYYDQAGADTFEVWADVARHYSLDADYTSIGGYSMGGYGTYKFATQFPDLFARAQPTVGPPGLGIAATPDNPTGGPSTSTFPMLASLRNVPFQMWVMVTDELVPFSGTQAQARGFDALDYRYEFWAFSPGEHLTLAANDQYAPSADFLGDARVDRNPAHVTYVRNPKMDFSNDGTTADHAYWVSGIEVSNGSGAAPRGTVDVRSEGFGTGDPAATGTLADAGALTGGTIPSIGYQRQRKEWGSTPRAAQANRLVIDAKNVKSVTIDPRRARVTCAAQLVVTTDAPLTVKLAGCPGSGQSFGAAAACGAKGLPRASVSRGRLTASRGRGLSTAGRAIAFKCVSNRRKPGKVGRVEVSVARKAGKRCRHLDRRGRLGRTASCSKNDWLRAKLGRRRGGKVGWTYSTRAKLARGSYVLITRAVDNTGTVDHVTRKFGRKTFRVR